MPTARPPVERPLLLLEMNEVPWRVVDYAIDRRKLPHLRAFFDRAKTFTTHCEDSGELSPWVTWPSLHRGLNNDEHGVKHLGQDVSSFRGTPIWEEFRARQRSIGICGSLQSWPPVDPGRDGFFVPDTFAHDRRCIPARVEELQQFNLDQVRANGRVVKRTGSVAQGAELLRAAISAGVRPRTFAALASQVALERLDRQRITRRPMFQTRLFWDVFLSLFDAARPPSFSTFFTNHVASAMHRYWCDLFPDDFATKPPTTPNRATIEASLDLMDQIVGEGLALQKKCPDLVVAFASSMGQEAVQRESSGYGLKVGALSRLLHVAGVPSEAFKARLAMVPQVAAVIADPGARRKAIDFLRAARAGGTPLFDVDEIDASLSITVGTPDVETIKAAVFHVGDQRFTFDDAGIEVMNVEPGTAYHEPKGVLAWVGKGIAHDASREPLPLSAVKSQLLGLAGL